MVAIAMRLVPLLAAATLLVLAVRWVARSWVVDELAASVHVDDELSAAERVRELGKLDAAAAEPLVRAAASNRAAIALAARGVIDQLVERWDFQHRLNPRSFQLSSRIRQLTDALAAHADEFDVVSHPWLQSVAVSLLELADDCSRDVWIDVNAKCEQVLAATEVAATPNGDFVAQRWPTQPAVPPQVAEQIVEWQPTVPRIETSSDEQRDQELVDQRAADDSAMLRAATGPIVMPVARSPDQPPPPLPLIAEQQRIPLDGVDLPIRDVATASDIALFNQLAGDDVERARLAALELARRGFGNASPRDARMLLSKSVDDRVALVNVVSTSRDLAAAKWLRMLIVDGAGEVRAASVGAIAVSGNAELRELAWQTALRDSDPRVAAWTERLRSQR